MSEKFQQNFGEISVIFHYVCWKKINFNKIL